ncbi:hypothetical protein SO694_00002732 [Aureococcus anophagefferens]|uniref:Prolyl 4-hydroxylase alpha subunit domain-containing protein n=1 Tax=Aureococcus anophagefferens TaxID=44056 RepID=A0ABR1GCI8_AURAN
MAYAQRATRFWRANAGKRVLINPSSNLTSTAAPPPPTDLALPDFKAVLSDATGDALRTQGYAVVDGAFGETWAHCLRDDIITLAERRQLGRNQTHIVAAGETRLLEKDRIFEAELTAPRAEAPFLTRLWAAAALRERLSALLGRTLGRQTLKVQVNGGGGACFPLHFDSDPLLDDRVVTCIVYLNPDWAPGHGGELRLVPFPYAAATVDPRFDRLALFSSPDLLHRVLPSARARALPHALVLRERARGRARRGRGTSGPPATATTQWRRRSATRPCAATWRSVWPDWVRSIEESHAPSAARDAAVATHAADVRRIDAALARRGVDPAAVAARLPLSREDVAIDWFR